MFAGTNNDVEMVEVAPVIGVPSKTLIATTEGFEEPPPLYCGIFKVEPTNVDAPLVPVVVSVKVGCTDISPLPSNEVEFIVLMFVPLTKVDCLPLNVFQSVEVKAPVVVVFAVAILIAGVVPPLEEIGAVPVTAVTPVLLAPSIIS